MLEKVFPGQSNVYHKDGTCPAFEKDPKGQKIQKKILMGFMALVPKKQRILKLGIQSIEDLREYAGVEDILTDAQIVGVNYYEDLNTRIPRKEIEKHELLP